jgi:hypothetical protein
VRLVDVSEGGEGLPLIGPATLAGADSWTSVSSSPVDPESLALEVERSARSASRDLLRQATPGTATVSGSGRSRLIALRVRPGARSRVAKRKRLLFRQRVRAGGATATIFKRRRLIRR